MSGGQYLPGFAGIWRRFVRRVIPPHGIARAGSEQLMVDVAPPGGILGCRRPSGTTAHPVKGHPPISRPDTSSRWSTRIVPVDTIPHNAAWQKDSSSHMPASRSAPRRGRMREAVRAARADRSRLLDLRPPGCLGGYLVGARDGDSSVAGDLSDAHRRPCHP
jgi:hypothetical protein